MPGGSAPVVVVMGVSGAGKSTVGALLAERLGWAFLEGDSLHPVANLRKLMQGEALDDADRAPWLAAIGAWISLRQGRGESSIVACSALKRHYRDALRRGRDNMHFLHLVAPPAVIAGRLRTRSGHWLPGSILEGQLALCEPLQADEPGAVVRAADGPAATVAAAVAALPVLRTT
jgi:gluconokinase